MAGKLVAVSLIVLGLGLVASADDHSSNRETKPHRIEDYRGQRKFTTVERKATTTSVSEPGSLLLLGTALLAGYAGLKRKFGGS